MQGPHARPPATPFAAPPGSLPESLPALLEQLWDKVMGGVRDRWSAWALPTLATVDAAGEPEARVIALRSFDASRRRFGFHTDMRSAKVAALAANPAVALAFWDRHDALQVRFTGHAELFRGDKRAWRDASPLSRSGAAVDLDPGTQLYASMPFAELPAAGDEAIARARFVLVEVEVRAIDWLWIGERDLRRARFHWTGADWAGTWVVP